MEPDPLREIREIRRKISEECDNDPQKVFDYYVEYQEKMRSTGKYRFVTEPGASIPAGKATEQTDERANWKWFADKRGENPPG